MISYYLLEVSLNHVTLCIFEQGISSRFRKYQVQIEYAVTDNETAACLHPSHFLRNKGDTANFDLEKAKLLLAFKLVFQSLFPLKFDTK